MALEGAEQGKSDLWTPDPLNLPQQAAFNSPATIIGYGGAAGGGKSDLALGLALRKHTKSIVFRRDLTQVKDFERRIKDLTEGKRTGFNHSTHMLTMPDGCTVEFGGVKDADDWAKFKGRDHDLKVFDEATEFLELQVRSLLGWLRTTKPGQITQGLLTFNPPTDPQGEWIIDFFAPWLDEKHPNPAEPGEIRWFAMLPDRHGEMAEEEVDGPEPIEITGKDGKTRSIQPTSRTFIRASVTDNSYFAGTDYERQLQSLPEPLRSQLLEGAFNASIAANSWQVLPTAWVQAAMRRGREGSRPEISMTALGVDVAHGGKDKTVLAPRYGNWVDPLQKHPGRETPDGKSAAALVVKAHSGTPYTNVDAIGYGASCAERLMDAPPDGHGLKRVYAINVGASDTKKKKRYTDKSGKYVFRNLRAEMYWRLREALDPDNGEEFCLPDDRELLADLCAPTYEPTTSGILVESKEDIKGRLKRSTDSGDAVALSMLPPQDPEIANKHPQMSPADLLSKWSTRR